MRNYAVALAVLLSGVATPVFAQTPSAAHCPPPDSLYSDRPIGPTHDLSVRGPFARYITFVIDSVYVIANQLQGSAARPDSATIPLDLKPADIERIEIVKSGAAARWNACPGVATVLIFTISKKWRPRHNTSGVAPR